jgi:hypothetical protein
MAGFSYFYFGQATQVLVTENLNKASGVTGFVLLRLGCFSITINELITVLVALSAYSTIPALIYVAAELIVDIISHPSSSHHRHPGFVDLLARTIILALAYIVSYLAYHVLGSVESIVGGVCSVSVSLLLPAVFYYKCVNITSSLLVHPSKSPVALCSSFLFHSTGFIFSSL